MLKTETTPDECGSTVLPDQIIYKDIRVNKFITPVEVLDRVSRMQIRTDDVIIIGYPKSGATWLSEVIWLLMNNNQSDAGYQRSVWDRVPLVEQVIPGQKLYINQVEESASPRLFKTHLPTWAMESRINEAAARVIYITRNPKDMLVSSYYCAKLVYTDMPSWETWFQMFSNGKLVYGDWFDHVIDWMKNRDRDNFLFLKYEDDMSKLTLGTIKKLNNFLGTSCNEESIQSIVRRTTFKSMQNNPYTNLSDCKLFKCKAGSFIRKGKIGDWKTHFTVKQNEVMDKLIEERLRNTNMRLTYC